MSWREEVVGRGRWRGCSLVMLVLAVEGKRGSEGEGEREEARGEGGREKYSRQRCGSFQAVIEPELAGTAEQLGNADSSPRNDEPALCRPISTKFA